MKWPESLTLIRHDKSAYNKLRDIKAVNPTYQEFKRAYAQDPQAARTRELALEVTEELALPMGDHDTPLADGEGWQARTMGERLKSRIPQPDVIFVSPYTRTHQTLQRMTDGWQELADVKIVEEERIREQDHGLAIIYPDWRVMNVMHPEQERLHEVQGDYWYRFPQGENVPDVRERLRSWQTTLIREYSEQNVLAVTHHLSILSLRANLERLDAEEFMRLDNEEKPINAGVTIYRGEPNKGNDGKLTLVEYNAKLY